VGATRIRCGYGGIGAAAQWCECGWQCSGIRSRVDTLPAPRGLLQESLDRVSLGIPLKSSSLIKYSDPGFSFRVPNSRIILKIQIRTVSSQLISNLESLDTVYIDIPKKKEFILNFESLDRVSLGIPNKYVPALKFQGFSVPKSRIILKIQIRTKSSNLLSNFESLDPVYLGKAQKTAP